MTTCIFPGCPNVLDPKTAHGLCRTHNHAVGLCKCRPCKEAAARRSRTELPSDLKKVDVPYPTSNSGVPGTKPVTIRKAPWE
jgi:hypothetical protein